MSAIEPRFGVVFGSGGVGLDDGVYGESAFAFGDAPGVTQCEFVGHPIGLHVFVVVGNGVGRMLSKFLARVELWTAPFGCGGGKRGVIGQRIIELAAL